MKVTIKLYGQFLLSSQVNYTCTYLAEHFEGLTHDNVQYFLKRNRFAPRQIWQSIKDELEQNPNGYIIFDDTVLNKEYSHKIELVRRQYSGNTHSIVKGIGIINCVYYNPDTDKYSLLDYRIFAPDTDNKSKIDHVMDMLKSLKFRQIAYRFLLMDSWYATIELFKYALSESKIFYCPIKSNRKIDDSGGINPYKRVDEALFNTDEVLHGKTIKIFKMSMDTYFKLFRVLVSTTKTEYLITNDLSQNSTDAADKESSIRWKVEQFHREDKGISGIENCQCRLQRSQRNHIAIANLVWTTFNKIAKQTKQTVYQIKQGMMDDYMVQQLKQPIVKFA